MLEELLNKMERIAIALEKIAGDKELKVTNDLVMDAVGPTKVPNTQVEISGQAITATINQQPVAQPQQPVTAVPLSPEVRTYKQDEIAKAMGRAIDMGKIAEIQYILSLFKVQALTELPESQYGDLVLKLKEIGVEV